MGDGCVEGWQLLRGAERCAAVDQLMIGEMG